MIGIRIIIETFWQLFVFMYVQCQKPFVSVLISFVSPRFFHFLKLFHHCFQLTKAIQNKLLFAWKAFNSFSFSKFFWVIKFIFQGIRGRELCTLTYEKSLGGLNRKIYKLCLRPSKSLWRPVKKVVWTWYATLCQPKLRNDGVFTHLPKQEIFLVSNVFNKD